MNRSVHLILLGLTVLALFMPYLSLNFNGETLIVASGFDLMFSLPLKSESEDFNFLLGLLDSRVADFLMGKTRDLDYILLGLFVFTCASMGLSYVRSWSEKPLFAIIYLINITLIFVGRQVYLDLWQKHTAAFFENIPEEMAEMIPKNMAFPEFGVSWWAILLINCCGMVWMIWRWMEIRRDKQLPLYENSDI
jgi:hypothetical protein